jgi:single-strand selective monofunctional uracil DNA glycosylase
MRLTSISATLADAVRGLRFSDPVAHAYLPLDYAREVHDAYLTRWGKGPKEALFLGMNPGPWGMAQTGIPFGAVNMVRDWLDLGDLVIGRPEHEHPKRRVTGFDCPREEVSGARLWGWARDTFGTPERFFARFFVGNYIPILFLDEGARNLTPDKLTTAEQRSLTKPCDQALRDLAEALEVRMVIGVGAYAARQAKRALADTSLPVGQILHPSPASPAANRGWAPAVTAQLRDRGIALD